MTNIYLCSVTTIQTLTAYYIRWYLIKKIQGLGKIINQGAKVTKYSRYALACINCQNEMITKRKISKGSTLSK